MKTIEKNALTKGDTIVVRYSSGRHTLEFELAQVTVVKEDYVCVNDPRLKSIKLKWIGNYGANGGKYKCDRGMYDRYELVTEEQRDEELRIEEIKRSESVITEQIKFRMERSIRRLKLEQLQQVNALLDSFNIEGL